MALRRFEIADDDGEQIVEIVGNSAGELADGFHFLPLEQPLAGLIEHLLGHVPFRDIARHLGKADQLASIVMDRIDHDACPEPTAILADAPALGLMAPFRLRSQERAHRHAFPLILLRVETREVLSDDIFGAITLDAFGSAVPSRDSSLRIEHEDRVVLDPLHQQLELLLARSQCLMHRTGFGL
jgi:hypothetical protein